MRFAGLAAMALAISAAAFAHPASAGNVVADPARIADVLKAAGYRAELKTSQDDTYVSSSASGYTFLVFFNGCEQGTVNCKSVQFYSGFTPTTKLSAERINAYTRDHRWGRFYLDEDGDPAVEMDLDLEQGGMSEELFKDNIAYWEAVLSDFGKFVFEDPAKAVDKPTA